MRLGSVRVGDRREPALVIADGAVTLAEAAAAAGITVEGDDIIAILRNWERDRDALLALSARLADQVAAGAVAVHPLAALDAPIPRPGKVIAIGRNYAEHAAETGSDLPPEPMIFVKHPTSVVGPFDDIVRPTFVEDLDYEAELAVVIGRAGRDISAADALDHVAGYCCANDVSARTAQFATGQFVRGKSFDTFCPMGPALVTRDEIEDPQNLAIACRVDGEIRQQSNTANMIFTVRAIVAHCSAATTLEPGDVILTGTPAGVALGQKPPRWLQPGQVCEVEIAGLGVLRNRVAAG